jgi:peptide/nickel transport system substrate-binding protein
MNAVAGTDRTLWRDRIGLFCPGSPLANEAGIEVLSGPRDYDKVKRDLPAAGYRGERIVVLGTVGGSYITPTTLMGTDQLRKAGINVDLQTMDFATLVRRRENKDTQDKGGWNIAFSILDGLFVSNPATHNLTRSSGKSGTYGWPEIPRLDALREEWLDSTDIGVQKQTSERMQLQLWQDVPYIPLGHWVRSTAHRSNIVDVPWGFAAFYGVRRV